VRNQQREGNSARRGCFGGATGTVKILGGIAAFLVSAIAAAPLHAPPAGRNGPGGTVLTGAFAAQGRRCSKADVSATLLNPFASYALAGGLSVAVQAEASRDWEPGPPGSGRPRPLSRRSMRAR
jgi:hypothetical protein